MFLVVSVVEGFLQREAKLWRRWSFLGGCGLAELKDGATGV